MTVFIKNANSKNIDVPHQSLTGKTLISQDFYQRTYYLGIRYSL
jgi:hypothetical protein